MGVSSDLEPERPPDQPLERRGVPRGRPHLELGVAARLQPQNRVVVAGRVERDTVHRPGMAAIEALRKPQDSRERPDHAPARPAEIRIPGVLAAGCSSPMVPRDECDGLDLVGFESP
jgi:hypothetical protein